MMNIRYILFGLLFLILLPSACVKEIEFQPNSEVANEVVVSGRLTNLQERQSIQLMKPGELKKQSFAPIRNARITLHNDLGNTWEYREETRPDTVHQYYLDDFVGEVGRTYWVEIFLENGKTLVSKPQRMPEPVTMSDLEVIGEFEEKVTPTGVFIQKPGAAIYANTTIPDTIDQKLAIHWDVYQVWLFQEFSPQTFPPDPWVFCFISDYFNRQNLVVKRISDLQPGSSIHQKIGFTGISHAFEFRTCFIGTQFTTNAETANYLEQTNTLLTPTGSIFDVPPALIQGNVHIKGDENARALGYFEVCSADLKREFVVNGQLGNAFRFNDSFCYPNTGFFSADLWKYCYSCHEFPNSSVNTPLWW
jgi:hypothetical protein